MHRCIVRFGSHLGCFALTISVFAGCMLSLTAHAALVENLTVGNPKALALGNAVTADPPGVDSIHFNPAGLARIQGRESLVKLTFASFNFRVDFGELSDAASEQADIWGYEDPVENTTSETNQPILRIPFSDGRTEWPLPVLIVPQGGAAYHPKGSRYTIGTSAFVPVAAGYIREDDDPGRYMGKELALVRLTYFSPTIAVELNDELMVGAGLHFSWQGLSALTDLRVPNIALAIASRMFESINDQIDCSDLAGPVCESSLPPFDKVASLEFDGETALSTNYNIGLLWQPLPWLTWGATYQSEAKNHMSGYYRMIYEDSWVGLFSGLQDVLGSSLPALQSAFPSGQKVEEGDAKVDLVLPQSFATGISVQVTPRLKVNIDARWMDWGVWEGLDIQFDRNVDFLKVAKLLAPEYATSTVLTIPRHYESVWNFGFGTEYQYNDVLALRAGWEPRKSSIPPSKQDVLLPVGDGDIYSLGAEYKWDRDSQFDIAVAYIHLSADVPAGSSTNGNDEDQYSNFLYNPYSGLNFKSRVDAYMLEMSYTTQF